MNRLSAGATGASALLLVALLAPAGASAAPTCARTLSADVVVLDQPLMFNRLGAQNVNGIVYALRRDVVTTAGTPVVCTDPAASCTPGAVALRPDKRPRPLVLRAAAGDCLTVRFQNLLAANANPRQLPFPMNADDQVASRMAGFHPQGLELRATIADDGTMVGGNPGSLVPPGGSAVYGFYAPREGAFLVTSHGATFGGEGTAGNSGNGMFAVVNVEPPGADFYRSQVTEEELRLATTGTASGGQPIVNYEAVYPATEGASTTPSVWAREGKGGLPILNMLRGTEIVHTDLNAMIVGPGNDGKFPASTYPLESIGKRNPTVPNRLEPFREFTVAFHDETVVANAFPMWYLDPVLRHTLHAVGDVFMVNYGSGGVGSEIIANRLGVGPMHDCLDCVYEEFFLTGPAVGDPAMVVDKPANVGLESCAPSGANCPDAARGPKATAAFYPDDPSNVHHSYISDFVKFRNVHTGKEHHIFHLHNHQWLFNAGDDNANYLDAQGIGPGGGYTYEINFGGSGNRNKSAGDAIFHCHFYPHFAQGMWELWRNHDVLEAGTPLAVSGGGFHTVPFALQDGTPAAIDAAGARARALPDGEIAAGTPIPALVPLPGKPMAPLPGRVAVVKKLAPDGATVLGSVARIDRTDTDPALVNNTPTPLGNPVNPKGLKNPGFPFWIGGMERTVGQRNPTPPLDMAVAANPVNGGWDGGLPRHALDGYAAAGCLPQAGETVAAARARCAHSVESRLDMTKELKLAKAVWFPEDGNDVERAAMAFHAVRTHPSTSVHRNGSTASGDFITNGSRRPVPGAPFHEPCIDDKGNVLHTGTVGQFFDATPGGFGTTGSSPFNADSPRVYKGANIQFDAVLNKLGYHFSQQRIISLWEDALPTITKQRPPEPLVMRMNTFDCTMYLHTNLVPSTYELDDYQIRTTTDIIGQHIHLPKWDLTTTDGSANGWNYEDGTLSPDAVRERIAAINAAATPAEIALFPANSSGRGAGAKLTPLAHPYFGAVSTNPAWMGARTTLQRWFSDPVVNVNGVHRGLGIIFTHDHFGPSTHQQVGLYATVLVEPPGSTWKHNETGVALYTRPDGGPTSWQAAIVTPGDIDGDGQDDSYREFYLEYSDFQHAYQPGVYVGRNQDGSLGRAPDANTFRAAVNPSVREQAAVAFPDMLSFSPTCPGGVPRPCPEGISADDPGYFVVNYRNEPVGLRVYNPAKLGPDGKPGAQTDLAPGDLAFALDSRKDRAIAALNVQPTAKTAINGTQFPPPINAGGVNPGDPFTPMMRAYYGDRVRVKAQAGGDEESHNVHITGVKWLQGGSGYGFDPNSGWKNAQHAGISEQFTFATPVLPAINGAAQADYAWSINPSFDGWWTGTWGLMRTYRDAQTSLFALPNSTTSISIANLKSFVDVCPVTAPTRPYDLTAVLANDVLGNDVGATIVPTDPALSTQHAGGPLNAGGGTLVFNPRATAIPVLTVIHEPGTPPVTTGGHSGPLHDPTAMLYVQTRDLVAVNPADPRCLDATGQPKPTLYACPVKLRPGAPVEPVVLRAAAGECITVALRNKLPAAAPDLPSWKTLPPVVTRDAGTATVLDASGNFASGGAMTSFNNNLVRPSSYVGLRPALVAHDIRLDAGLVVGSNPSANLAAPGTTVRYRWYAGDLSLAPAGAGTFNLVATPIEFGGANLFPADPIKQGQKGLVGALVVHPPASTWTETDLAQDHQSSRWATATRETRASATVNGAIRDFTVVVEKGMTHRYGDGAPVEQIHAEGAVGEDSEDAGQMALNYGSEPMWFRFGMAPNADFGRTGFASVTNAHLAYANTLAGGDPATPVFTAKAGSATRIHLLEPTGANRASTFTLHGHVWQRQPFVCPGSDGYGGLPGTCGRTTFYPTMAGFEVASRALGVNPLANYTGAQDLIQPGAHFELVLPSAGGSFAVPGDYLLQDRTSFGNTSGLWGILRVQ